MKNKMKIYHILFVVFLICCSTIVNAQQFKEIYEEILKNNTSLSAYEKQLENEKISNYVGLTPSNPEVEFAHLWGTPSNIGNRINFNVTQSFDFPSVYYYRKQIADGRACQAEIKFDIEKKKLFLQVKKICVDIVYYFSLKREFQNIMEIMENISNSYQKKYDKGEIGIIELNNTKLNLLDSKNDLEKINIEIEVLLSELSTLNGGKAITVGDTAFKKIIIPDSFDTWYLSIENNNSEMNYIKQEIFISEKQIKLSKSQWMPKFSLGYQSEMILGTNLQGIGLGISVPLWENINEVKSAKVQSKALQLMQEDSRIQFYSTLKNKYIKLQNLQKYFVSYNEQLEEFTTINLLKSALDSGEISFLDYLAEQKVYFDSKVKILDFEREMQMTYAELQVWE